MISNPSLSPDVVGDGDGISTPSLHLTAISSLSHPLSSEVIATFAYRVTVVNAIEKHAPWSSELESFKKKSVSFMLSINFFQVQFFGTVTVHVLRQHRVVCRMTTAIRGTLKIGCTVFHLSFIIRYVQIIAKNNDLLFKEEGEGKMKGIQMSAALKRREFPI